MTVTFTLHWWHPVILAVIFVITCFMLMAWGMAGCPSLEDLFKQRRARKYAEEWLRKHNVNQTKTS